MRFTSTLVLSTLCWTFQPVSASTAHVYIRDSPAQPRAHVESRDLSPIEARMVFAQRAGVEDYHRSDLMSEGAIQAINDFGHQTPMFADRLHPTKKAFILVEGDASSEAPLQSLQSHSGFRLTSTPDVGSSRNLFIDMVRQSEPRRFSMISDTVLLSMLQAQPVDCNNGNTFYIAQTSSDAETLFTRLAKEEHWSITTLLLSHSSEANNSSSWGTYSMPKRQSQPEAPLTDPISGAPLVGFQGSSANDNDNNGDSGDDGNNDDDNTSPSTPLRGILPSCFSSQSACESATRNCTGHGSCGLKFSDPTKGSACYACSCSKGRTADGSRTVIWAGPACQKKDISVEFWLITLFTVGLIGLIGFAIGAIWEMGSQPLPSVIGAGVSGTGARK